jgi:HEAT repeat protein
LKDSDKNVRAMAAWALSQIEDPNAATALRAAMKDVDASVRRPCCTHWFRSATRLVMEALAEMLKDSDPEVRRAAAALWARMARPTTAAATAAAATETDAATDPVVRGLNQRP